MVTILAASRWAVLPWASFGAYFGIAGDGEESQADSGNSPGAHAETGFWLSRHQRVRLSEAPSERGGFQSFPGWLKSNLYALLDPALLYLEDSSRYLSASASGFDVSKFLNSLENGGELQDYERHRHLNTYMSWAAVVLAGQLQDTDREEYITLEVQLQCDWFYICCLDRNLGMPTKITRREIIDLQRQSYELEILEDRLLDFDDSSMPSRILEIQRGLVATSGLENNIQRLRRKIRYLLDREQLEVGIRQKRLGQSSELLLFLIAVIEIAPTVSEYGNRIFPHAGALINALMVLLGIALLIWKN